MTSPAEPTTYDIRIGLSGWDYEGWRGDFYPQRLAAARRLGYVAERFDAVEVNGSFYALQRPTTYRRWREQTADDFMFALKGGRFVTHLKRLRDVDQGLANFFASGPLVLGPKLGPVLWQLPASLPFDAGLIGDFLASLPRSTAEAARLAERHDDRLRHGADVDPRGDRPLRHALEVRDRSYDNTRFLDLLTEAGIALVVSDSPTWPMYEHRTTDLMYVRLHGHTQLYASGYSARSLDRWAERCLAWAGEGAVHVYFDNDARGRAPYDARALAERVGTGR